MKSSWPIVIGFCAVALAAVWYDAKNEAAAAAKAPSSRSAGAALVGTP